MVEEKKICRKIVIFLHIMDEEQIRGKVVSFSRGAEEERICGDIVVITKIFHTRCDDETIQNREMLKNYIYN